MSREEHAMKRNALRWISIGVMISFSLTRTGLGAKRQQPEWTSVERSRDSSRQPGQSVGPIS